MEEGSEFGYAINGADGSSIVYDPRLLRGAVTVSGSGRSTQGGTPRASAILERVCMLGLLSLLASRRHIVPYANPEAVASCNLVRRARLRAALILFSSLGATCFPLKP
jgi:hypothetical protein